MNPIEYDPVKAPLNIGAVMRVPHVLTVRVSPIEGTSRGADGRLPHVLYTTALGFDARTVAAAGPSYDDPLGFHFDAGGAMSLPYLGTLYVVGGRGRAKITIFSRTSEERCSPSWPLPPQPWSLTHAGVTPFTFVVPSGSNTLRISGPPVPVSFEYSTGAIESYTFSNQDRPSLSGVASVTISPPAGARVQATIVGAL